MLRKKLNWEVTNLELDVKLLELKNACLNLLELKTDDSSVLDTMGVYDIMEYLNDNYGDQEILDNMDRWSILEYIHDYFDPEDVVEADVNMRWA